MVNFEGFTEPKQSHIFRKLCIQSFSVNTEPLGSTAFTIVSVAARGDISWVYDPNLVSYALEQAERLISHARANKVVHNFAWTPLYN